MTNERLIEVVPYNPEWPEMFEKETSLIKQALGDKCVSIHHIGSTSIPGCDAKPIIDILLVIPSIDMHTKIAPIMENLGYLDRSDYAFFMRLFFKKSNNFNVHVFEKGYSEIDRFLKFRNWMRRHPDYLNDYIELKKSSAKKYPNNFDKYCTEKENFVSDIEWKAGYQRARIVKAYTPKELKIVTQMKAGHNPKDASSHFDLIVYKGSKLIGCVFIQLMESHKALIKLFSFEDHMTDVTQDEIISDCKKWLKTHGVNTIYLN